MLDTAAQAHEDLGDAPMMVSAEKLVQLGGGGKDARRNGLRKLRAWLHLHGALKPINGPTAKPGDVRAATVADENALLELMMLDVRENAIEIAEPSPEKILEHIQAATRRRGGIIGMIDGPDGKPIACINITPFQWWWSRAYFLQEVWNFVHPDHRESKHADSLMRFARWCSDDMTAGFGYRVWLLQGVTSKSNVDRKVALYSRYGNYIGAFFIYPHPGADVR